jgi:hypothetical protein
LVNLFCAVVAIPIVFRLREITPPGSVPAVMVLLVLFGVCVVFFTLFIVLCRLFVFVLALGRPGARDSGGAVTLALALAPWPVALLLRLIIWLL